MNENVIKALALTALTVSTYFFAKNCNKKSKSNTRPDKPPGMPPKKNEKEKKFEAWAAMEEGAMHFEPYQYTPPALGDDDVELKVIYSAMCASDYHQVLGHWGNKIYPLVPGHEIVGEIVAKGANVNHLELGDKVGIGAQRLSCLQDDCSLCSRNYEPYCDKCVWTYNHRYWDGEPTYGGYAKSVRCHSYFTIKIPEKLPLKEVAPLFCAGITVYDPLDHFDVRGKKLAVLGIGGLGHLGVKYGVALGNEVVGVSRTTSKREDCLSWGAADHIATDDPEQLKKYKNYFDVVLCTVNGDDAPWNEYFKLCAFEGEFIFVGIPNDKINFDAGYVLPQRLNVTGSEIGSPVVIKKMLDLSAQHNILPVCEIWPISKLDEAWEAFIEGKPKYRYVLDICGSEYE